MFVSDFLTCLVSVNTSSTSMDIVNEVLQKAAKEALKFKSILVEKHLEVVYDVGNLLAFDDNELDSSKLRSSKDEYLRDLTRDNTQLLFNKIWELPTKQVEEAILAELPKPVYKLPRALPVPTPKEPTRWEKFAQAKGIVKTKRSKLEWDEILQKWLPRYGFKRAQAEKEKSWFLEVPGNADPYDDQFEKRSRLKRERVAKNELQRMRNIAAARKVKIPHVGTLSLDKPTTKDLHKAATIAKVSTASVGKFQAPLEKEKPAKAAKYLLPVKPSVFSTKRLKNTAEEAKSNAKIVDNILNKKPKIDMEGAVNKYLRGSHSEGNKTPNNQRSKPVRGKKKGAKGKKKGSTKTSTLQEIKKNMSSNRKKH